MSDEMEAPVRRGGRPEKRRNVAEPEAVVAHAKTVQDKEERAASDLRHLLAQPEFRRYVWRWMAKLKMWSDLIPLNSELYIQTAEKRVALRMWREIEDVNPAALLDMMQAAKAKEME
jgi:hypothetical protein